MRDAERAPDLPWYGATEAVICQIFAWQILRSKLARYRKSRACPQILTPTGGSALRRGALQEPRLPPSSPAVLQSRLPVPAKQRMGCSVSRQTAPFHLRLSSDLSEVAHVLVPGRLRRQAAMRQSPPRQSVVRSRQEYQHLPAR